ncbi:MAG TPA: hypothetical protein VN795_02040 [Stellaceae bacterium]|jgi:hypothetical protein|nr:hypothetical protein [Stellaceae bacterium]
MTIVLIFIALAVALGGLVTETLAPVNYRDRDGESEPPRGWF